MNTEMLFSEEKRRTALTLAPLCAGVAVGGGWQALVAYINLFCYYVVGLPLGFLLGYKTNLHVKVFFFYQDNVSWNVKLLQLCMDQNWLIHQSSSSDTTRHMYMYILSEFLTGNLDRHDYWDLPADIGPYLYCL